MQDSFCSQFFDTHAHLYNRDLGGINFSMILESQQKRVTKITAICTNENELAAFLKVKIPGIYIAAATLPDEAAKDKNPPFYEYVDNNIDQLIAIGETGLDSRYYTGDGFQNQSHLFRKYIALAATYRKPLLLHCFSAFDDVFKIIRETGLHNLEYIPGVCHCFTGNLEQAEQFIQYGWMISISGIATFKNARDLQQTITHLPLESLVAETDAPFLAPAPHRGKENTPAYIIHTIEKIASLKGLPVEMVAEQLFINAEKLFQLHSQ